MLARHCMQGDIYGGLEMSETEISKAARTLSKLGASKGGLARAEKMTPEQRKEVAQKAAEARWGIPTATYPGEVRIGDMCFPCSVLSDGTRILTQSDFMAGMGMYYSGWVGHHKAKDQTAADHENGRLVRARQKQIAQKAKFLMRALAHVGIIALVDEATGYQEVRDRLALQQILDKFLRKELAAWAKCFPEEFYRQIFRLRQWQWRGMKVNRPQIVAHYTKDLIYARLAPGILKELEVRNPKDEKGHRKAPHYAWLTEDIGHPALAQLLFGVIGLMRIAEKWDEFMKMVDKAYPRRGDTLQLDLFQNDEFYVMTHGTIAVAK